MWVLLGKASSDIKVKNINELLKLKGSADRFDKNLFRVLPLAKLPESLRTMPMLGRGTTSVALRKDHNTIWLITTDDAKRKWLTFKKGIYIGKTVKKIAVKHKLIFSSPKVFIIQLPVLRKLSNTNRTIIKKELKYFDKVAEEVTKKFFEENTDATEVWENQLVPYLYKHLDKNIAPNLYRMIELLYKLKLNFRQFDLHLGNFMEDGNGNIIIYDLIIGTEVHKRMK